MQKRLKQMVFIKMIMLGVRNHVGGIAYCTAFFGYNNMILYTLIRVAGGRQVSESLGAYISK